MSKRIVIEVYLLCCVVSLSQFTVAHANPPNIVVIVADDLGWNDVGYHGSEILTPTIDHLAHQGVRLENYYVQPMCSPSRSALLSGRYPIHTGLQHGVIYAGQRAGLPLNLKTLAQELKEQGYTTHGIGKWHLGFYKRDYLPVERGFDSWFGYLTGNEDYYTKVNCEQLGCGYDFYINNTLDFADNNTYSTIRLTERAREIIQKHDQQRPLFLYLPYQAVHFPLQVPDSYIRPYSYINDHNRRTFAGMASCMDESISNITSYLKQAGMWNDTVLIFTTDNGGETSKGGNNWPLRGKKWTLWEGGIRGVAFVHSPILDRRAGSIHRSLMHISDWYPTILEGILGKSLSSEPLPLDGVNMWESITSDAQGSRTELLHNIDPMGPHPGRAVFNHTFPTNTTAAIRMGEWKLLTGSPGVDKWFPVPTDREQSRHRGWLLKYLNGGGREDNREFVKKALLRYDNSYHHYYGEQKHHKDNVFVKNVWLFNITADPEEIIDLSDDYPSIVKKLLDRLAFYESTSVVPNSPKVDPLAAPDKNNGTWQPWVHNSYSLYSCFEYMYSFLSSLFWSVW